ncbi:MAG: hypothetical protein VKJ66_05070 [Synechococcus sp.]|nr:hypothetical protein [Synechococcus sp.]
MLITKPVLAGLRESRHLFPQEVSVSLKGVSEALQVFPCLEPA